MAKRKFTGKRKMGRGPVRETVVGDLSERGIEKSIEAAIIERRAEVMAENDARIEELREEVAKEEEKRENNSVVDGKFKRRYIIHAREAGIKGKAARRSNWDWLSQQIARECLEAKDRLNIDKFMRLLSTNQVDSSKWTNRNRGWEGRLRMTGRVALQRVVADRGWLNLPDGSEVAAPAEFIEKYKTKVE